MCLKLCKNQHILFNHCVIDQNWSVIKKGKANTKYFFFNLENNYNCTYRTLNHKAQACIMCILTCIL